MIPELFESFNTTMKSYLYNQLKEADINFKPKWVVATYNERTQCEISFVLINEWIKEQGIIGHCFSSIGAVMFADDTGMTLYSLRWADEYL